MDFILMALNEKLFYDTVMNHNDDICFFILIVMLLMV
jgi:hypothetical protein